MHARAMPEMPSVVDHARAVHLAVPTYVQSYREIMEAKFPAVTAMHQSSGVWELLYRVRRGDGLIVTGAIPFNRHGPAVLSADRTKIHRWGVMRIGPGTWVVEPSIVQHDLFHAFVVIAEVPEPAPWTL